MKRRHSGTGWLSSALPRTRWGQRNRETPSWRPPARPGLANHPAGVDLGQRRSNWPSLMPATKADQPAGATKMTGPRPFAFESRMPIWPSPKLAISTQFPLYPLRELLRHLTSSVRTGGLVTVGWELPAGALGGGA